MIWLLTELRLVEAESSSTLLLSSDADVLNLHCSGDVQSQLVWYYNDELVEVDADTSIATMVTEGHQQSLLTRTIGGSSDVDGQYQCRDASGYMADSDVLLVIYA